MLATILGSDGVVVIVVLAIVMMFGGAKLPSLARGLGSASHEYKKGLAEGEGSSAAIKQSNDTSGSDSKKAAVEIESIPDERE